MQKNGKPERASFEKGYLKSSLTHYGVSVPEITRAARSVGRLEHAHAVALAESLWVEPVHERRMAAAIVLRINEPRLEISALQTGEEMLRNSGTWALVDTLAVHVAGPLLGRHPQPDPIVRSWGQDDNFWMRRSALLVHLKSLRASDQDWERFAGLADSMLDETEFFIRKAIGWVLRDMSRRAPDLVYDWILPRAGRASGVTIREVVKWLAPGQAAQVKAAYTSLSPHARRSAPAKHPPG